jgi:hypothetical protein
MAPVRGTLVRAGKVSGPCRMDGYRVPHEALTQLRGAAAARQVPGAEVAVAGGPIAGCMLLTS